jgi:hypothetical protein
VIVHPQVFGAVLARQVDGIERQSTGKMLRFVPMAG